MSDRRINVSTHAQCAYDVSLAKESFNTIAISDDENTPAPVFLDLI